MFSKFEIREMVEEIGGSSPFKINDIVKHPDGRTVKIISGAFWGTYGLSNFWYWQEILPNNKFGPTEHGYGWRT
jgi:hypothetical protein